MITDTAPQVDLGEVRTSTPPQDLGRLVAQEIMIEDGQEEISGIISRIYTGSRFKILELKSLTTIPVVSEPTREELRAEWKERIELAKIEAEARSINPATLIRREFGNDPLYLMGAMGVLLVALKIYEALD